MTMTAVAVGEGVLALRKFMRKLKNRRMVEAGDALELRTPDGDTVVYRRVNEEGDCVEAVGQEQTGSDHHDKPSQMGLA